jgi:DnaK suppressor protein
MDTHTLRDRLEAERNDLSAELRSIAIYDDVSNEWQAVPEESTRETADSNLEADVVEDWNQRRSTVAHLSTRYRNITRALDKIATGTYGRCEISGEPIEIDRLTANPAARTCKAHLADEGQLAL